jgi:RHS repeat-associated protein
MKTNATLPFQWMGTLFPRGFLKNRSVQIDRMCAGGSVGLLHYCALICLVMTSVAGTWAQAQSSVTPSQPIYACAGLACEGVLPNTTACSDGSLSTLASCIQGNYNAYGQFGKVVSVGSAVQLNVNGQETSVVNIIVTTEWTMIDALGNEHDFFNYFAVPVNLAKPGVDFPPQERNQGAQSCAAKGSPIISNPINASTGNKYEDEPDYDGVGAFPLVFHRYYNSVGAGDGSVGQRWTHSFSRTLVRQSSNEVKLFRNDAEVRFFQQCGTTGTAWCATADESGTLTQTINGSGTTTGWQYTDENDVTELYDGSGTLLSETSRAGVGHVLAHNNIGLLSTITDSFGHQIALSYDSSNRISQLTEPGGGMIVYKYDSSGNLSSVTYPDNATRTYLYDESADVVSADLPHLLTGILDEAGKRFATFQYDSQSRAILSEHAGGAYAMQVTYNSDGSVTALDALGASRTYTFQSVLSVNHVLSVSGPTCSACGNFASYGFDAKGDLAKTVDFNGNQTLYSIDSRHLEESRTEASGTLLARTITTQWHPSFALPLLITEPTRSTKLTYDGFGNLQTRTVTDTTVTPNVSRTWTYPSYNGFGQVLTVQGPRSDVTDITTYTYYSCTTGGQCGQVHTVTDALGHVWTYNTYNAHGQPLTITDPNGVLTTLGYDARQRLVSRTVAGDETTFSYYPTGLLQTVILPDGSALSYSYDDAHRLRQINDGLGNKIVYTLDAMGNRKAEQTYDPSGALHLTHTRVFNTLSQLYEDVNAANTPSVTTTYGYDSNGNQASVAAPLARTTGELYDALNRLKQITDPAGGVTQFGYDTNDNLTSVTDPRSLVTSHGYNGFGDLTSQLSPDTGSTTNTYDSAGNLQTTTDARGAVATFAYDPLNRVTSVAYSRGSTTDQTIIFTYDSGTNGAGHLTGASDANHSLGWSYNASGQVISKSQTVAGVTRSLGYAYTSGNLTTLTTPSGQTVTYGYNSNHQITSLTVNGTTVLTAVTYEPLGPVNGWTWGNSTSVSRVYDGDGNIAQIFSNGQKVLSYDNASRISGITDTAAGASNWTYGYDALDRLTSGGNGAVNRGWTYDANGNRLTETGASASTYAVSSISNQITGVTGALARTYSYDAAGHTTGYANVTATYNDAGRLNTVSNGSLTETLVYDALGQRIETSGGAAGTVLYWYDEQGHLLGEYDGSGNLIEETVWLGDIPVATLRPSGAGVAIYYVHTDQLNAPRQVTRPADNAQMWTWFSDPFGTDAAQQNPAGAGTFAYNLRFPGQVFDGQVGLHSNGYRDFDPAIGGYIQSDPLGLQGGGWSTYTYVGDSPIMYVDLFGLCWEFSQSTGQWSHLDDLTGVATPVGLGFSGQGVGYNDPAFEWAEDIGPLPAGLYQIGPGRKWHKMPYVMDLTPVLSFQFGRPGGFKIHAPFKDPAKRPLSSHGCPIAEKDLRKQISDDQDRCLWVVP